MENARTTFAALQLISTSCRRSLEGHSLAAREVTREHAADLTCSKDLKCALELSTPIVFRHTSQAAEAYLGNRDCNLPWGQAELSRDEATNAGGALLSFPVTCRTLQLL